MGEKAVALGVAGIMKAKSKLGIGTIRKRPRKKPSSNNKKLGKGIYFAAAVRRGCKGIAGKKYKSINNAINDALVSIKKGNVAVHKPRSRIIPVPKKTGGILPLIPLFVGLSALGALGSSAATIANAINVANSAKNKLAETLDVNRHTRAMETIPIGKGLFLGPYKKGCGLYLKPYSKNH